ncbi:MAG: DMT family transporter [Pseudomonadota bacterium]
MNIAACLLVIMGLLWGIQFSFLRMTALAGLEELPVIGLTLVVLTVFYYLVLTIRKQWFRPTFKEIGYFTISGLLGSFLPFWAAIYLSKSMSAGTISLLASASPIITFLAVAAIGHERITATRCIGVLAGLLASLIVLWPLISTFWAGQDLLHQSSLNLLIALAIPLAYGLDVVYISAFWPKRLNALQVLIGETSAISLVLLPIIFFTQSFELILPPYGSGHLAMGLFIIASIIETFIFFYLIRIRGSIFVSISSYIAIVAGVLWGIVLLGEQHEPTLWLAIPILILAVFLVSNTRHQKGASPPFYSSNETP